MILSQIKIHVFYCNIFQNKWHGKAIFLADITPVVSVTLLFLGVYDIFL